MLLRCPNKKLIDKLKKFDALYINVSLDVMDKANDYPKDLVVIIKKCLDMHKSMKKYFQMPCCVLVQLVH